MARAGFYVDGYNVYHAIKESAPNHLKWASYMEIAIQLALPGHSIEFVKLFTALPRHRQKSIGRHIKFNKAQTAVGVDVILGKFKTKQGRCHSCGSTWDAHEEKETDVNLSIHLLNDARLGALDAAYILTSDSDISAAVRMCAREFPNVELISVSTMLRAHSKEILQACHRQATLSEAVLRKCLLPASITLADGSIITRPIEYSPPA